MDAILYVGEMKAVKPEFLVKLERYGLELMNFGSTDELMPYLNADFVKVIMIYTEENQEHSHLKKAIENINTVAKGRIPIALVTTEDSMRLRQSFIDFSYVHFMQYTANNRKFRGHFEGLLAELEYREQMRKLKFAVLDDDKLQLKALFNLFSKHGINDVHYFSHPDEFDQCTNAYDVYLIDLVMPAKSGEEVIFETRKCCSDAVIIAVSSLATTEIIAKVLSLGANDFIVKPYNETIFMAKLLSNSRLRFLLKENRKKNEELEEIAVRDPMTNLFNHRKIKSSLEELEVNYLENNVPFSVIMMDIDHFKQINDNHGHQTGDLILKDIAKILNNEINVKGVIGRYGGEEFIVLLPSVVEAEAFFIAERIRRRIESHKLESGVFVTISMGVAEQSDSTESIIETADVLLYEAKRQGRNRVVCKSNIS